jgi:serine protease Do
MRKQLLFFLFAMVVISCSKPTQFLVKSVMDAQTIELEDGTIVKLIGVNGTTNKYVQALQGLQNNFVLLYDENYDPIKEIYEGNILAYVYDIEGNCINDFALSGEDNEDSGAVQSGERIVIGSDDNTEKERVSGKTIEVMPATSLSELYERNKNAVFLIAVPKTKDTYSQGTGFFINSSGIGVSNFHVFEGGNQSEAVIKTIDNRQYKLKRIITSDKDLDFIVFEVENDHNDFPYLTLATEQSGVGEEVFAIGNPQGLEHTLSKGIISSYRENNTMIQTTTEITHGSSGGPLFNLKGEVIGITTSGVGEANLNFAMNVLKLNLSEY